MNVKEIYPDYRCDVLAGDTIRFETYIRIKYRKIWYIIPVFIYEKYNKDIDIFDLTDAHKKFISNVYKHMILIKINPKLMNGFGEYIHKKDTCQKDEVQRLIDNDPFLSKINKG